MQAKGTVRIIERGGPLDPIIGHIDGIFIPVIGAVHHKAHNRVVKHRLNINIFMRIPTEGADIAIPHKANEIVKALVQPIHIRAGGAVFNIPVHGVVEVGGAVELVGRGVHLRRDDRRIGMLVFIDPEHPFILGDIHGIDTKELAVVIHADRVAIGAAAVWRCPQLGNGAGARFDHLPKETAGDNVPRV